MNLFTLSLLLFILLQYIGQALVICDTYRECEDQELTDSDFVCSAHSSCYRATLNCVENRNCTISCSHDWACNGATINAPFNGALSLDCVAGDKFDVCATSDINCKNGECMINCYGRAACYLMDVYSQPDTTKIDITASGERVLNSAEIHCPSSSIGGANEDNCNIVIEATDWWEVESISDLEIYAVESFNDFYLRCNYQTSSIGNCYHSNYKPTVYCGADLAQSCTMQLKSGSYDEWECVDGDNVCNDYIVTSPPTEDPTTTYQTTSELTTTTYPTTSELTEDPTTIYPTSSIVCGDNKNSGPGKLIICESNADCCDGFICKTKDGPKKGKCGRDKKKKKGKKKKKSKGSRSKDNAVMSDNVVINDEDIKAKENDNISICCCCCCFINGQHYKQFIGNL